MKTVILTSRRLRTLNGPSYVQLDANDPNTRWPTGQEVTMSKANFDKLKKADLVDIEEVSDTNESGDSD